MLGSRHSLLMIQLDEMKLPAFASHLRDFVTLVHRPKFVGASHHRCGQYKPMRLAAQGTALAELAEAVIAGLINKCQKAMAHLFKLSSRSVISSGVSSKRR